ncbi:MAG: CBS domain-containing protein [Planctomycetota bacterium]|jgi:CBS domain-containing protein
MLKAKDIMTEHVISTKKSTPIYEAVELLIDNGVAGIPVVEDDGTLVGILSEKDVLRLHNAPNYGKNHTVDDYMTQPAVHFDKEESLAEICNCLLEYPFRRVPVTSDHKLVGIVSRRDIIKCIVQLSEQVATAEVQQ